MESSIENNFLKGDNFFVVGKQLPSFLARAL